MRGKRCICRRPRAAADFCRQRKGNTGLLDGGQAGCGLNLAWAGLGWAAGRGPLVLPTQRAASKISQRETVPDKPWDLLVPGKGRKTQESGYFLRPNHTYPAV